MIDIIFILDFLDDPSDEEDFLVTYEHYKNLMMKIALDRLNNNYELAEECVQDSLIKIAKSYQKLDAAVSRSTKSYICSVVRTTATNMFHKEINRPFISADIKDEMVWEQSQSSYFEKFEAQELSIMLDELPDDVKSYITLYYVHGHTNKEISKMFNISYYLLTKKLKNAYETLKGDNYE